MSNNYHTTDFHRCDVAADTCGCGCAPVVEDTACTLPLHDECTLDAGQRQLRLWMQLRLQLRKQARLCSLEPDTTASCPAAPKAVPLGPADAVPQSSQPLRGLQSGSRTHRRSSSWLLPHKTIWLGQKLQQCRPPKPAPLTVSWNLRFTRRQRPCLHTGTNSGNPRCSQPNPYRRCEYRHAKCNPGAARIGVLVNALRALYPQLTADSTDHILQAVERRSPAAGGGGARFCWRWRRWPSTSCPAPAPLTSRTTTIRQSKCSQDVGQQPSPPSSRVLPPLPSTSPYPPSPSPPVTGPHTSAPSAASASLVRGRAEEQ